MTTLKLHNTKTRAREEFVPIDPENVRLYLCGPTVYDRAHLGNARPVIVFDVLNRLLRHLYGADHVTYVRNFTDVDDRINETAQKRKAAGASGTLEALIHERSDETIAWYHSDMDALGASRPTHEPRATEYIAQMVAMIEELIAKGHAYEAEGHVLFAVDSWRENYGNLSGRSVDDMIAGARVEVAPYKRNPMDFVMWKPSPEGLPGWDSPWGKGRPGWHIECSAMADELLWKKPLEEGKLSQAAMERPHVFDIHGGGNDLMFPHHENEIAQSCCANETDTMANYWLHNEMLQVEGKKMSKSLGNFFTVRDLLDKGVPGEVIRFVMLSTHYRKPMDWTEKKREEAERKLEKWRNELTGVAPSTPAPEVIEALASDLNCSQALQDLEALFLRWMQALSNGENSGLTETQTEAIFLASARLLGLLEEGAGDWTKTSYDFGVLENALASLRDEAMESKDFSKLDAMKKQLVDAGVEVRMSKEGIELRATVGLDTSKLVDLPR